MEVNLNKFDIPYHQWMDSKKQMRAHQSHHKHPNTLCCQRTMHLNQQGRNRGWRWWWKQWSKWSRYLRENRNRPRDFRLPPTHKSAQSRGRWVGAEVTVQPQPQGPAPTKDTELREAGKRLGCAQGYYGQQEPHPRSALRGSHASPSKHRLQRLLTFSSCAPWQISKIMQKLLPKLAPLPSHVTRTSDPRSYL